MISADCRLQKHFEYAVQIRIRFQMNRHEKYVSNNFVQDTIVEYFRSIRDKSSKSWLINITVFHKTIFETSNVQVKIESKNTYSTKLFNGVCNTISVRLV